jgi:PTS system nitrogen regulatory IIA component
LVVPELQAQDKSDVVKELAGHLASQVNGVDREQLAKVLLERERLASTAIGEGVAIPHGKLDAVGRLVACVGRARGGVDFDSMDSRPTHLFFVLVAPENSTGVHLKALARISRLFKDPEFRTRLMQAKDGAEMYKVIADEDAKY